MQAAYSLVFLLTIGFSASKIGSSEDKQCIVGNRIYQHRQLFVRSCNEHCMCYNGLVTCTNPCAHEFNRPPLETCRDPRLVRIPGQCCQEWQCAAAENSPDFSNQSFSGSGSGSEFGSGSKSGDLQLTQVEKTEKENDKREKKQPRTRQALREAGLAPAEVFEQKATAVVTACPDRKAWSQCSTSCGPGISTYYDCKTKKLKTRICNIRPCSMVDDDNEIENRCQATVKSKQAVLIHFEDCWTIRKYRPKYCGLPCKRKNCCMAREVSTKTKLAKFECLDGRNETHELMWIKRCECDAPC